MTAVQGNGRQKIDAEVETEKSLLGAVLHWPQSLCEIATMIRYEDFRTDAHQRIYRAIVTRWDRGKFVDLPTIADDMKKAGDLESIAKDGQSGYEYLAEVWESGGGTATSAHAYAGMVRERSILRSLALAASEIQRDAESPTGPADEMLANAEKKILEIATTGFGDTTSELHETLQEAMDRIDLRKQQGGRASGVPTGFYDLDEIISGLQDGELIIVAARPSVGKTSLGMSFALSASRAGVPVLFLSLEQSKVELSERMLCIESKVDSHQIRTSKLSSNDMDKLLEANSRISKLKVVIDDANSEQTVLRIASSTRRAKRRHKIGMVCVDYLQLIQPEDARAKRYEQVGAMTRRLKMLAKELQVPVVVMCQLNRESENRAAPRLSDLRESGNIEQDADVVLLMHRAELSPGPVQEVVVNVAKNRNGRCGQVILSFVRHCTRFENHSPIPD